MYEGDNGYDIWDTKSRNVVAYFETLAEAEAYMTTIPADWRHDVIVGHWDGVRYIVDRDYSHAATA